jgi:hypothetical protein
LAGVIHRQAMPVDAVVSVLFRKPEVQR